MRNLDSILKSRDISSPKKVHLVKTMVCPVVMYGCESWTVKSWAIKNWCFWTVVLEKTLESPLDCKEIQPVHSEGNKSWVFIGRTVAETETPIFWPPDVKNWLMWKDPDTGKDWRWEAMGMTEDEMVSWHHQLHGHEFEQTLGVGDEQGNLTCCSPWSCKESDMTEWLNWFIYVYTYTHTAREREKLILFQNLQGRLKCWRPKKEVLWQLKSEDTQEVDFPLLQGTSVFSFKIFNWFVEAHPYYRGWSDLLNSKAIDFNHIQKLPQSIPFFWRTLTNTIS